MSDAFQWASGTAANYQYLGNRQAQNQQYSYQMMKDWGDLLANLQQQGWQSGEAEKARGAEAQAAELARQGQMDLTNRQGEISLESLAKEYGYRGEEATAGAAADTARAGQAQKDELDRMAQEAGYQDARDAKLHGYNMAELAAKIKADAASASAGTAKDQQFASPAEEYVFTFLPQSREGAGFLDAATSSWNWDVWLDKARVDAAVAGFKQWYRRKNGTPPSPALEADVRYILEGQGQSVVDNKPTPNPLPAGQAAPSGWDMARRGTEILYSPLLDAFNRPTPTTEIPYGLAAPVKKKPSIINWSTMKKK